MIVGLSIDVIDHSLIMLADQVLADHFFDPDAEDAYKTLMVGLRSTPAASALILEPCTSLQASCLVRIEAMRDWSRVRMTMADPDFCASVEGDWSFNHQELSRITVTHRGDPESLCAAIEAIRNVVMGRPSMG